MPASLRDVLSAFWWTNKFYRFTPDTTAPPGSREGPDRHHAFVAVVAHRHPVVPPVSPARPVKYADVFNRHG